MNAETFALVVTASFIHAGWNLVSKKAASAGGYFVFAYRIISVALYAPWVLYVLWTEGVPWSMSVLLFITLSSLFHLGYGLCLQWGYRAADLSVVYPIARGTGPLLSSLGAFLWLAESPSTFGVLGIFCVVTGIMLIATQGNWRQFAGREAWVGVFWGALIGVFIASYTLTDAYSVKVLLVAPVVLDWLAGVGNAAMMGPRVWLQRKTMMANMKGYWRYAIAVGVMSPLAYILVLFALQRGAQVSLVAPLREMSLMIATVAGFFILKERASAVRVLGCGVIIAGVLLLSR
jgi:drug/metabolite transporter (DMT)-like permease